jgi:hypothetical protein
VQGFELAVLLVNELRQHASANDQKSAQDNNYKDSAGTVHIAPLLTNIFIFIALHKAFPGRKVFNYDTRFLTGC